MKRNESTPQGTPPVEETPPPEYMKMHVDFEDEEEKNELKHKYGGHLEKLSYGGTTILGLIIQKHIIIGMDTKGTHNFGSMLYSYSKKLRLLDNKIIGAWAGDALAGLELMTHLRGRIIEYYAIQVAHGQKDKKYIGVKEVASWALQYLKSQEEDKIAVLIAGYEPSGLAYIYHISKKLDRPVSATYLVLGSGEKAAQAILDTSMTLMRLGMSPEDGQQLAMDSLIAAAVTDPDTGGDALHVYQMTQGGGCSMILKKGVLEGYKERISQLKLKPETENRVLYLPTTSQRFVPEHCLFNFFRENGVSKCINLGGTSNGSVIYRVVFRESLGVKAAYARACYEYQRDVRRDRLDTERFRKTWRYPNPYKPFVVDLALLDVQVRWINVYAVHSYLLVFRLTSLDQLRIITEVPFEQWPTQQDQ